MAPQKKIANAATAQVEDEGHWKNKFFQPLRLLTQLSGFPNLCFVQLEPKVRAMSKLK